MKSRRLGVMIWACDKFKWMYRKMMSLRRRFNRRRARRLIARYLWRFGRRIGRGIIRKMFGI